MNPKQQAGKRGGLATLARHGKSHFQKIGKRGAAVFWKLYRFEPAGMSDFAIVHRETGEVKNFISGKPWQT